MNRHQDLHTNSSFRCSCPEGSPLLCFDFVEEEPLFSSYLGPEEYINGADEVTWDNCASAFYRFTFELPCTPAAVSLAGVANVDDQGVVFLNGVRISASMLVPACNPDPANAFFDTCYDSQEWGADRTDADGRLVLTWPTQDPFGTSDASLFRPGENELVFAICGDASYFDPTGVEFVATVTYLGCEEVCPADITCDGVCTPGIGDGLATLSDFTCYLSEWSVGSAFADVTGVGVCDASAADGAVTLSDFSCFLSAWSQGCP